MDSRLKLLLNGDPEEVLMLLIRLKNPSVIVPFCKPVSQFGDVITSRVQRKHLLEVYNSPDILSVKAPRLIPAPLHAEDADTPSLPDIENRSRRLQDIYTGKGIYFAAVDWGFDFAHANLRKQDGTTKFKCIWDQNGRYDNNIYGYGCVYSEDEINTALKTDIPYQTLGYHPGRADVIGNGMHGTHVIDIATGTPVVGEGGVAPEATVIAVELGNNFVNGSDLALGDSVRLVEALDFISKAAKDLPCVINMSLGSHGDSHTGKSLVEIALDNFLSQNAGFATVQSVGNYYLSDCHIAHTLKQGEHFNLEWLIPRRNPLANEVEIWYAGSDEFSLKLVAPDEEVVADVEPFKDIEISYDGIPVGYIFHRSQEPNTGLNHIDIILDPSTPKGKWIIEVIGTKVSNGSFHAYSERNDAGQAKFSKHQTSRFTTTGSVCNSKHTITAGAYNHVDQSRPVVSFSSSGPTAFGQLKPDLLAPGFKIVAARSAPGTAAQPTNLLTVKSGSSMAAPHTSGLIALLFQKCLLSRLHITKTKQLLLDSLDPLPANLSTDDRIRSGRGYLNIKNLLKPGYIMNGNKHTRPVRRPKDEIEVEDVVVEQEIHAPYLHQHCDRCKEALLQTIGDGTWANEPDLLGTMNNNYFNVDSLEPFALYRHFHPKYPFSNAVFQQSFASTALPGRRLTNINSGDIILIRNVLSGKTMQAIVTDPQIITNDRIEQYPTNSQKPGYYVRAFGNISGNGNQVGYIRIANKDNRILDNVLVIKKDTESIPAETMTETAEPIVKHDDVKGRVKWFLATRVGKDTGQTLPYYSIASAKAKELGMVQAQQAEVADGISESPWGGPGTNNWTPLGPSVIANGQATSTPPVSGRITSIAVNNQNRIYIGSANGGVWYSGNGGQTWESHHGYEVSPSLTSGNSADSLAIGAVAVKFGSSKTSDEVWVGTGEPNGSDAYFGIGIWHRLGGNWTLEANNLAGHGIYKIAIDPSDSSRVFASTTDGLYKRNVVTSGGRSTITWDRVAVTGSAVDRSPVTDFIIAGTGAGKKHYAAFQSDKVYEGNHNISAWTAIPGTTSFKRIALAAGNTNSTIVYAFDEDGNLYKLINTGTPTVSFVRVGGSPISQIFNGSGGGQGDYDIILAVDPDDDNRIFVAGDWIHAVPGSYIYDLSLHTGLVGGTSPHFNFTAKTLLGTKIHPDGHAMAFSRYGGKIHAWVGCDGGLFHSDSHLTDGSYGHRNVGISSAQINYIAQREDTDAVILAGSQDNGTLLFTGDQVWFESSQGDGGGVAIDPNPLSPFNFMAQYVQSHILNTTDGGNNWSANYILPGVTADENNKSSFYGPIATFLQGGTTMVVCGTDRLWLSYDWGTHWVHDTTLWGRLSTATEAHSVLDIKIASGIKIYAVILIRDASTFRFIGSQVIRYDFAGTWIKTTVVHSGDIPAHAIITAIDIDNAAPGSFYLALGGAGTFERCLYYDGTTIHNAGPSTTVLNIPCHAVVADKNAPHHVYLGSDVGVWKGVRNAHPWTLTWSLYSQGLPEAAIMDLKIHSAARLLRAATHGRGVWEIALDATSGRSVDIYLRANAADSGRMNAGRRFPWVRTAEDPSRTPTAGRHNIVDLTMSPDIKVWRASLSPIASHINYYQFEYYEDGAHNKLGGPFKAPNWQLGDATGVNQVFVRTHNRGLDILQAANIYVTLLMADATSGNSPDLPAGFTAEINAANTSSAWLTGSHWKFADSTNPHQFLTGNLNVRTPQIVKFNVRFTDLPGLTRSSKVALLAFVTTVNRSDKLVSSTVRVNDLIMEDKHVSQRYVVFA